MSDESLQKIEREIVAAAADGLLAKGFLISVFDGEEVVLVKSASKDAVIGAMFSTDEDYFYVYAGDGQKAGFVRFVYGNDGWDVICDYSSNLEEALYEADKIAERYSGDN